MSLPVGARVWAVPNFLSGLARAHAFMAEQDAASAPARFKQLQAEMSKARALLSFAPASGRPARFLDAQTQWGQFQADQARQLARALRMPELRAFVLARHVLLYAHGEREVVLLSLRHERQLGCQFRTPPG